MKDTTCDSCGATIYADGLCLGCYCEENRLNCPLCDIPLSIKNAAIADPAVLGLMDGDECPICADCKRDKKRL